MLNDRINQEFNRADRKHEFLAVLYLDLDHFKLINDGLGHGIGDALLKAVAGRISACLRNEDTISRIGGDEFIALLPGLEKEHDALVVVEKIITKLREIFILDSQELNISVSIGAAMYPRDGKDAETLIRNADTAMYKAKDQGRDGFQFYSREMNQNVSRRLKMQSQLSRALERNELTLFYQAVIDLQTDRFVGVEALLRWHNKELGDVSPVEFIPVAEESGLIVPIGQWVLDAALQQAKIWQDNDLNTIRMSVNLSGRQLLYPDLVNFIEDIIDRTHVDPALLILEITESMLMDRSKKTLALLNTLREKGMKIAIDDFGTGYSSLSYLKDLPVDKLKIDRSFVSNINESEGDKAITLAIIAMAKKLGLVVVAEGAETAEEVDFLRQNQCDEIQGYYFSKPLPVVQCEELMRGRNNKAK
ncbi:MAG: EAL domain-containing protein [Gammaproteobacteria bacterium]|nr:EAL domain-containing protein [Gammaproteobacteria bacterium]